MENSSATTTAAEKSTPDSTERKASGIARALKGLIFS
jgi:hypothetical protein